MNMATSQHMLWQVMLGVCVVLAPFQAALACTRVLWNDNILAVVVGRTMD